jgi:ABC-type Mn2+/Zn2+ transport system permease subunit/Mn-dependent DtxR family transcriptional regulator
MENILEYDYAIRALFASAMVGLMCGLLGCFIFLRNMALVGDALSHAILPGVVVGFLIAGQSVLAFFTGSVLAGLFAALLITWIQTRVKSKEDAAIGVVFTTMFSLGVIGISILTRQEGVHLDLKDFLFGNVLAITTQDLMLTSLVGAFVLFSTVSLYRYLFISTFDATQARAMGVSTQVIHYFLMLLLSFTVVACMQSVGVILVVGMLIMPASAAYTLTRRLPAMLLTAALIGMVSTIGGFVLAFSLDITPGPAMNVVGAFLFLLAILFSPENGKIQVWLSRRRTRQSMKTDDLIKALVSSGTQADAVLAPVQQKLGWSNAEWKRVWAAAVVGGWIDEKNGSWALTGSGVRHGFELLGAHRTWEQFMVENLGYDKSQVHRQAEELEHFLTPQLVDEIREELGRPIKDPHGAYIPQPGSKESIFLSSLNPGEKALLLTTQEDEHVMAQLWQLGLSPNFSILILRKEKSVIQLRFNGEEKAVSEELAARMQVVRIV